MGWLSLIHIWEGEYGRRSHLIPVFQQLLREQDASSLQMLSLFVNNNPYNLEFFIAVSYDLSLIHIYRANEVRPILKRVAGMAERTGCGVILIGHMNKAQGLKAGYRGLRCV